MKQLRVGWHSFRKSFTLVGWLYIGKLILALIFTLPLLAAVNASLDNSAYSSVLLRSWSLEVITELIHRHQEALPAFVAVLIFYSMAVFVFRQFLNGGIYHTFKSGIRLNVRTFFAASGGLFRGNLIISLFMLLVYFVLAVASQLVASFVPADIAGHYGAAGFTEMFVHLACLYVFLIAGSILSDILRFRLAAHPEEKFLQQLRPAFNFYFRRFVKLNSIYYLYFLPMAIFWVIIEYLALAVTGGLANIVGVFLELVLFQLCSFARTGQSLLFVATVGPMAQAAFPGHMERPVSDEVSLD